MAVEFALATLTTPSGFLYSSPFHASGAPLDGFQVAGSGRRPITRLNRNVIPCQWEAGADSVA
jgi:hypothetical protein